MEVSQCHSSHVRNLIHYLHTSDSNQTDRWTTPQLDTHKKLTFRSKHSTCTDTLSLNSWSIEDFTNRGQSSYNHSLQTSTLEQHRLCKSSTDDELSASWCSSDTSYSLASTDLSEQEHNRWLSDFCSYSSSPPIVSQQHMTPVPAYLTQHPRPIRYTYHPFISATDASQTVTTQDKMKNWEIVFDWYENDEHTYSATTPNTAHNNPMQVDLELTMTAKNGINNTGEMSCQDASMEGKQHSDGLLQVSDHDIRLDETETMVMDATYWNKIGMELQETEQDVEAIDAFRRAVDLDVSMLDAWLNLAISYANEHQRGNVYDCLEAWLQHNDKYQHISVGNSSNRITMMTSRNTALIERFILAARCAPGVTLEKTSRTDSSPIQYIATTILPSTTNEIDTDVQVILGLLFYLADETQKSTDCFKAALACRPDDHRLWNQLGSVMLSQQHGLQISETSCDGAMEMYRSALCLNPEYTRARYNLAVAHMKVSQYEQAAHHLVTALTLQRKQRQRQQSMTTSTPSSPMWSSLRLVMYMLNFDDLAAACNRHDLTPFGSFLDNPCTFTPHI